MSVQSNETQRALLYSDVRSIDEIECDLYSWNTLRGTKLHYLILDQDGVQP